MSIIGPYGSGKSVFLRQLLVNLWRLHGWKFLLTSFEEKVKPRYQRDLRRHLIGKPMVDVTARSSGRMRRSPGPTSKSASRRLPAAQAHAVSTWIACSTASSSRCASTASRSWRSIRSTRSIIRFRKGESKTDYMGRFIMALKALADDYGLLMICCAHPPKDGVEKRLSKSKLLTLNDGADTAH